MKYLYFICCFILANIAFGQSTFHKYYGGSQEEYAYAFAETSDGGFIVAGRTFSFGSGGWEGYVLKLDDTGDTSWVRTYGNLQYDEIQDIYPSSDGGYIMTGHTWTTDWAGDIYLIKIDVNGNLQWDQTYGGATGFSDKGYSVRQTTDGGYVLCGTTESFGQGGDDLYVIKTNVNGSIQWTRTVGSSGTQEAGREIQQTIDGGYIITGYTDGNGSFLDVLLVKLDQNGNVSWSKTYGGNSYDFAYSVEQTTDNGYIIGATTNSFGAGDWDAYLIKTNSSGTIQWSKTYGLNGEDRLQAVRQSSDGGYILGGRSGTFGAGGLDATLIKTNSSGTLQWSKAYGGAAEDQTWYVSEYSNGGYVLCGYSLSFGAGSRDLFMIKTDANGLANCNEYSGNLQSTNPSSSSGNFGTYSSGGSINTVSVVKRYTNTINTVQCESSACPVQASFTILNSYFCENESLSFQNTSSGATSYNWFVNGNLFSMAIDPNNVIFNEGYNEILLVASDGICADSSIQQIVVDPISQSNDIYIQCDSFIWMNGLTYFNSNNTATFITSNTSGCDSIITLDLTIHQSSDTSFIVVANDSFLSASGNVYITSGNFTDTIDNQYGCDSIIHIDLQLLISGWKDIDDQSIVLFPNPSQDKIQFNNLDRLFDFISLEIIDMMGKIVFQSDKQLISYPVKTLSAGLYQVCIYTKTECHRIFFTKH